MYIPYFLSCIIFLPVIGALFILTSTNDINAKITTIGISIFNFILSLLTITYVDFSVNSTLFLHEKYYSPFNNILSYNIAIDSFSIFFVIMINFISVIISWWMLNKQIEKIKHFAAAMLFFVSMATGAFVAQNLFLMIFFIEGAIIPLVIMICSSGSVQIKESVLQLVIYNMISALLITIGGIMIYDWAQTANLYEIYQYNCFNNRSCFFIILIGIAVKIPTFPLHLWLPKVHTDAPTECSILLASIMLKFGSLLTIKVLLPIFNPLIIEYKLLISIFFAITICIACASVIFETDLKKIFANISIIHMNIYFLVYLYSKDWYVYSIIYHSVLMCLLFCVTDILQNICKTRSLILLKDAIIYSKLNKFIILLSCVLLIEMPLTWGFFANILAIISLLQISYILLIVATIAIIVLSTYFFYLYINVFKKIQVASIGYSKRELDLQINQKIAFILLFIVIIFASTIPPI